MATKTICDTCGKELESLHAFTLIKTLRGWVRTESNQVYEQGLIVENVCDECMEKGIIITKEKSNGIPGSSVIYKITTT